MRKYYNPDLSAQQVQQLDWENYVTLMAGQSLLGSVTPNMIAVLVETELEASITLHFILRCDTAVDRSEADEAIASLQALLSSDIEVNATIAVDPGYFPAKGPQRTRPLFLRAFPAAVDESPHPICRRCGNIVLANAQSYETFEGMHWSCFHYVFEHEISDGTADPDMSCRDPSCPARTFDPIPPASWLEERG